MSGGAGLWDRFGAPGWLWIAKRFATRLFVTMQRDWRGLTVSAGPEPDPGFAPVCSCTSKRGSAEGAPDHPRRDAEAQERFTSRHPEGDRRGASRQAPQLWFQDEARVGNKGRVCHRWWRKRGTRQIGYQWAYIFSAVRPDTGELTLVMPRQRRTWRGPKSSNAVGPPPVRRRVSDACMDPAEPDRMRTLCAYPWIMKVIS